MVATIGVAGIAIAPAPAAAEGGDLTVTSIGGQAELVNGGVIQAWTVLELQPSQDAIPYPVQGTLWEALVTDEAVRGSVTPIVSDFNARAAGGQNYRALFQVPTALGISPATLAEGQEAGGKIYFDVTGEAPDSVVYNAFGEDLIVWEQPPAETIIEEIEVYSDGDETVIIEDELIVDGDQVALEETDIVIEGDQEAVAEAELDSMGY
jgi:hypothetical protein